MHIRKLVLIPIFLSIFSEKTLAQDSTNLMNQLMNEAAKNKTVYTQSTFKYTHVINGQSVESLPANVLDVRILHRFGPMNSGIYNFFGLDYSPFNVKVGFDYGITDNFMVGIAHSGYQKTYDGFFKVKIFRQSTGSVNMPISVSFVPTIAISTLKAEHIDPSVKLDSGAKINRASYAFQLLIARKFSEGFALQITPSFIYTDNISYYHPDRDVFAIGVAASQKLSKRIDVNAEYFYQMPGTQAPGARNVLSFGIGIG